jgi:NAD(P)-dependent dehydrogenase (short-subunit alcohol dehydrogenase family)
MSDIDLTGHVAVVTGAGRGMGRTHALDLARRGARVIVNDLPPEAGEASVAQGVVEEIQLAGGTAVAVDSSVADRSGAEAVVAAAADTYGRLDILVNNAGIVRSAPFDEMTDELIDLVLDVNLMSMIYATQAAYRQMKPSGYGRIVNIGSQVGVIGMHGGMVNYGVSKGGALGLTVNLAHEIADTDIRINLVMPNATTTITSRHPIKGNTVAAGGPNAYKQRLADRFEPEVVTALVTFLASPQCHLNGEAFSVMGARYGRVVTGISRGWISPEGHQPTAEDILDNLDAIRSKAALDFPLSTIEEYELLDQLLPSGI